MEEILILSGCNDIVRLEGVVDYFNENKDFIKGHILIINGTDINRVEIKDYLLRNGIEKFLFIDNLFEIMDGIHEVYDYKKAMITVFCNYSQRLKIINKLMKSILLPIKVLSYNRRIGIKDKIKQWFIDLILAL